MRLGFASIYAFRPHVEHNEYVAHLARQAGHEVVYLTCDAQLPLCYARALKGSSKLVECPRCMLGGVRSYAASQVHSLKRDDVQLLPARAQALAFSSACTILRIEAQRDLQTTAFQQLQGRLAESASRAYAAARGWIERERLDGVVCFNGRFEANRAVIEAAADAGIPYLTVERTWFGDGLQFAVNANCLDLSQLDRLNAEYCGQPLSEHQAGRVAKHIAARFLRRNDKEWRAYNQHAQAVVWPTRAGAGSGPRVLIVPGSRNEVEGHPDWKMRWPQMTDGLDAVLDAVGADPRDAVLRCHPNWGERIGLRTGALSERYYAEWARRRCVHFIDSRARASTLELIAQADLVIVTGGSAAFETGALGKPLVSLSPSTYQTAAICTLVEGPDQLEQIRTVFAQSPRERMRRTLRYGYTHVYRFSQFVNFVHAETTTRYRYFEGADVQRIERMLRTLRIDADDPAVAADPLGEDLVLSRVEARDWPALAAFAAPIPGAGKRELHVRRRNGLRWIDSVRELLPHGDR